MNMKFILPLFVLFIALASCSSDEKQADSKQENGTKVSKEDKSTTDQQENGTSNETATTSTSSPNSDVKKGSTDKVPNIFSSTLDGGVTATGNDGEKNTTSTTTNPTNDTKKEDVASFNIHEYTKLNAFLRKYVTSDGHVKYASIKSNKGELDEIITEFESTTPESSWSRNEKLAFWINAYNIFTIQLVVDNYPTTSITKITAKPWEKKFVKIGGTTYSLGGIENDVIRKKYNEPRVHFALNCASESCPNLLNKAYMPNSLTSQLTAQTKAFLNDGSKNKLESSKSVELSKIFDWYKEDFNADGGVISFINKYRGSDLKSPKISYLEYSWDLNK